MDLEETVNELAPKVLRYCRARMGDADLAGEIAQEALAALVARWRRAGPPDSAAAFVFRIASRRAGRRLWIRRLRPWVGLEGVDASPAAEDPTSRIRFAQLRRDVARLSKKEREALLRGRL